ncbi:hypothetical protein B0T20DRAFT_415696 [Sordaria brevicollis]|uniref:Uncharacterized protein n=1 Tax=Sordaria brevicollis TaxID=83679 RepID=A0AAE0PC91_SORBR|nr:hypothetical protein B0T20DRAFT_415696 [Sordaria brevicollis]
MEYYPAVEPREPYFYVKKKKGSDSASSSSTGSLLLRISAAADYFTSNSTLMLHPPPVDVDIILDPFLFNVLPRSLVPTIGWIGVVAVAGWMVAKRVVSFLVAISEGGAEAEEMSEGESKKKR